MTIREKYGFQSWEDINVFFRELFEKCSTWTFVKPSGHPYTIKCDDVAELWDIIVDVRDLERLYKDLDKLPFYETMPAMDELYELIPKDSRNPAAYMRRINNIYSIFSAPYLTGVKNKRDRSKKCDYYETSGELISWLKEDAPKTLTFSDDIHKIKSGAFEYCNSLVRVVVPESVEAVEEDAFSFDDEEIIHHSNFLIVEVQGENTELLGCPYTNSLGELFPEYPFIYIVAPAGSKAMQFAIDHEYPRAVSMTDAIEELLSIGRELENTRDEARDFWDTEVFLRKAELAVDYGLKNGADPRALIFGFCRIAFFVTDRIRDGYFEPKKAISYLVQYDLVEEYLMRDELEDENAWVRVLVALKKYDIHTYRKYIKSFLLQLDPHIAEDYVAALYGDASFNLEWGDMFSGGVTDEYEEREFWKLGAEIADLFIMNRLPKWKGILEWCEDILDEKSEAERYGYFSEEWVENMRENMKEDEDEDEDEY